MLSDGKTFIYAPNLGTRVVVWDFGRAIPYVPPGKPRHKEFLVRIAKTLRSLVLREYPSWADKTYTVSQILSQYEEHPDELFARYIFLDVWKFARAYMTKIPPLSPGFVVAMNVMKEAGRLGMAPVMEPRDPEMGRKIMKEGISLLARALIRADPVLSHSNNRPILNTLFTGPFLI